ncbi:hypothetical protein ACLOJK_008741 [Asimina triloba]
MLCAFFSPSNMSSHEEAGAAMAAVDRYRSFMHGEGEKDTQWRHGAPPSYDLVNKLFEEGRTKTDSSMTGHTQNDWNPSWDSLSDRFIHDRPYPK